MHITIIIGKSSNLSIRLFEKIDNCSLLSSREIAKNIELLHNFKNKKINLIFNNFQPAINLNNVDNSSEYITNSILVTAMVLDYFKNTDINKIIYTSSSSVYGNNILCKETDELKPINLHASLKVANEKLIEKYCKENDVNYTITRIFNMYGGEDKFSVISKIINAHLNNKELTVANNGNAIRDFVHIDDVISIYLKLLKINDVRMLNIGTGSGTSIKSILDFLSNNNIRISTKSINIDELKISTADNRLLKTKRLKDSFIRIEDYLKEKLNL